MTVSIWVPVAVALIAAVPVVLAARWSRRSTEDNVELKRVELALSGMTTLLAQVMEDRQLCWLLGEAGRVGEGNTA